MQKRWTHAVLMVIFVAALPVAAGEWSDPEIAGFVTELAAAELPAKRRESIVDQLAAASTGPLVDIHTVEAIFVLSRLAPEVVGKRCPPTGVLSQVVTLYPADPRIEHVLRRLASNQLQEANRYGAHYTLTRLFRDASPQVDAEFQVQAARNALLVGDAQSALEWSSPLDTETLDLETRVAIWRTRLTAAQSLGLHGEALTALDALERESRDALVGDPETMLAAARTDRTAARLESADQRYRDFINVYTRAPQRAEALLEHAELLAEMQRNPAALRVLEWLVVEYGATPQAEVARVLQVDLGSYGSIEERATAYRHVAIAAHSEKAAITACSKLLELLIAEGQPLEAISNLTWMVLNTKGFAAIAARRSLIRGLDAAMNLLQSRDDMIGLAAVAAAADRVGLPIPHAYEAALRRFRGPTGITTASRAVEATMVGAQAAWISGDDAAALKQLERGLSRTDLAAFEKRRMIVLRADIRHAASDLVTACQDYRAALELGETLHVKQRSGRCPDPIVIVAEAKP